MSAVFHACIYHPILHTDMYKSICRRDLTISVKQLGSKYYLPNDVLRIIGTYLDKHVSECMEIIKSRKIYKTVIKQLGRAYALTNKISDSNWHIRLIRECKVKCFCCQQCERVCPTYRICCCNMMASSSFPFKACIVCGGNYILLNIEDVKHHYRLLN